MKLQNKKIEPNEPIAIIGMGCLFPKSSGLKAYWRLLFRGEDAITDVPESHWLSEDYYDKDPRKPDHVYCKRGGFISPVSFDPAEFAIPPNTLGATDTSQLLGLVVAKKALEDAGYGDDRSFDRERTSVILGVTGTQELVIPLSARLGHPIWRRALENSGINSEKTEEVIQNISDSYVSWQENSFPGLLGNVVAGRISNRLNLGGTNCVVDAACASSMSAVYLGVMELLAKRCDMVITGGVDTLNDIFMHMCFSKTMVLSPTGDVRPFSQNADGTVLGEGIGLFVLKRLGDAEKDGDRIYGVIKGMGTSSDGKSQSIYAPRAEGQLKALQTAYLEADIEPSTVELVEAHGTGTRVGDAVEFQALNRLFGKSDQNGRWCALGSVKSNIGHTKAASGAAGLMKAVLSIHKKVLPPTLKANDPDPKLNIHQSPFYLNTESRPWFSKKEHPRRSGISAFGFGGSNFHVVIEEYQKQKQDISWDGSVEIVALSNSNQKALKDLLMSFKTAVDNGASYEEISIKAGKTRHNFSTSDPYRLLIVIERTSDLTSLFNSAVKTLESNRAENAWHLKNIFYGDAEPSGKLAFIFPGQGSQYVGMGRDLVSIFPDAFEILETANIKYDNLDRLTDSIYPRPENKKGFQEETLRRTDIAQPAIGAVSIALLKVLQGFGIQPDATCGHSFGEFSALCAAGWIDLDTLLHLSIIRGRLMAATSRGKDQNNGVMLAVKAPLEKLDDLVEKTDSGVVLANRNSPDQGVLSGSIDAIEKIKTICDQKGFKTIQLPVSAAFHSSLVKDAQKPFIQTLKEILITPTRIPVFSNTTGKPYPADSNGAKELLGKHLLCPVDFMSEIENLFDMGVQTFVEVGPKFVLTGLVNSILKDRHFHAIALDDSSGRVAGMADLARTLCHLASIGHFVDLKRWEQPVREKRKQVMSIPIAGVNYRKQKTERRSQRPEDKGQKPEGRNKKPEKHVSSLKKAEQNLSVMESDPITENRDAMNKNKNQERQHSFILEALKVVQEGLNSMQALQTQTAKIHQTFLETQTDASRTLQKMMENAQRLAEASLGVKPEPRASELLFEKIKENTPNPDKTEKKFDKITDDVQPIDVQNDLQSLHEPVVAPISSDLLTPEVSFEETILKPGSKDSRPPEETQKEIEHSLLDIVGQLTGYPVEMLDLGMDIEADLGIDSIKRVEILSVLEEKISHLPSISPETMGSMKTLGQIVEYLAATSENDIQPSSITMREESTAAEYREIESSLLETVSQLTGYPTEMLDLDMNIEADLGIDSIKRVEILSVLEEKIPNLPTLSPEIMGSMNTLGQIVEYLSSASIADSPQQEVEKLSSTSTASCTNEAQVFPDVSRQDIVEFSPEYLAADIQRKIVSVVNRPFIQNDPLVLPSNYKIFITDDQTGLSKAIADRLDSMNIDTTLVSFDRLPDEDPQKAAGLIIIPNHIHKDEKFLKDAFSLTHRMAPHLLDSASKGGALFATITRLDGAFGFKGAGVVNPMQGGLAGLAKTASLEWDNVSCHAIDIAPDWQENDKIAKAIVNELLYPDASGPVEIGFDSNSRFTLALETAPFPQGKISLNHGDVVVVTGGARGVTASAVYSLAKHAKPTLVLLGRSPLPTPEPDWLVSLKGEAKIKKAILENEFNSQKVSPSKLEMAYKGYMANREIVENLERIRELGADVRYYSVDVRNFDQVNSVLDEVRSAHGTVKGIVHGAGILEDRWIVDKTLEQFETVFDTKVKGLNVLLEATKQDPLEYLVLFSSMAARLGNNGQADYAMANEVLNKIAQQESATRSNCKVVSINWGPWDGGMVCSALKRKFKNSGIELIPEDAGAMCMIYEMWGDKNQPAEVVIGSNMVSEKEEAGGKTLHLHQKHPFSSKEKEKHTMTIEREAVGKIAAI